MNIPDLRTLQLPGSLMIGDRDVTDELSHFIDTTVQAWTNEKLLSDKQGYGLVATKVVPVGTLLSLDWDNPLSFLGYGVAAHGASLVYMWNAARKVRLLARARAEVTRRFASSLEIAKSRPDFVRDAITEGEREAEKTGGPIRWGDFPYGGAAYGTDGINEVMVGTSIWLAPEDHRVSGAGADYLLELAA